MKAGTIKPKRSEMAVRAGCRRCAEDGRQKKKEGEKENDYYKIKR